MKKLDPNRQPKTKQKMKKLDQNWQPKTKQKMKKLGRSGSLKQNKHFTCPYLGCTHIINSRLLKFSAARGCNTRFSWVRLTKVQGMLVCDFYLPIDGSNTKRDAKGLRHYRY